MPEYDHLIIGGGMAAAAAATAIREGQENASIGIISDDTVGPYNRPPLSKGLWTGDPEDSIWRGTEELDVQLHLGRRATNLDVAAKSVRDDHDTTYTYGTLLLATGGKVHTLPGASSEVIYYRTFADYQRLRQMATAGTRVAIVGGGFIGSEVAAALTMNGVAVTMIFPEAGIGTRIYPPALSEFLSGYFRDKGVEIIDNEMLAFIEKNPHDGGYQLRTKSGKRFAADAVVAGIGVAPEVELAQQAGLTIENGIVVDEYLRTSVPDIYAAGDVANFHSVALGKRVRVEHEDNANTMGRIAGQNMAGGNVVYDYIPLFYSDLFELGYEAVGDLDARLETVEDWKTPFREGVVYYLENGRVRGVLLWNTWDQVDNARALIADPGPFTAAQLKGRLPA